ncbi:hypothetical protein P7C70_g3497, partial [Phenoliferia sp. Uapishka_3]
MSRNKRLTIAWSIFSFLFVSSAIVIIIVATIWKGQDANSLIVPDKHTLRAMSISELDLSASLLLAIVIILTSVVGLVGFYLGHGPRNGNNQRGLLMFNYTLVFTMVVTVVVGSIIWFFTLTLRKDFEEIWLVQKPVVQSFLQDSLKCCGYWNATTSGLFTQATGFCSSVTDPTTVTPCVGPITGFADFLLENTFTSIYGFSAVQVALFLTTCCLIISRHEEARFRVIDMKTGGGFV